MPQMSSTLRTQCPRCCRRWTFTHDSTEMEWCFDKQEFESSFRQEKALCRKELSAGGTSLFCHILFYWLRSPDQILTGTEIGRQSGSRGKKIYGWAVWINCWLSEIGFLIWLDLKGLVLSSYSDGNTSFCNAGDPGSIPGLGRSPGEGNGSPLQYSCLENPMDCGAWWATVHGVTKCRTGLSDFSFTFTYGMLWQKVII